VFSKPPPQEKGICHVAMLIERARVDEFVETLQRAARSFDSNHTLEYSGPWPPYSFVRLRLQAADAVTIA
jgi:hypothetical protein